MGILALFARDSDSPERPGGAPPPRPSTPPGLAVGISDRNANLLWASPRGGDFEPWRERVEALKPRWYRLMVDWAQLQPERDGPFLFDQRDDGCLRDRPPCREFGGMRDVLRAVRSQQREHGGWEIVVTIYGVPEWAARRPGGCERSTELPRSRPISRKGFDGYRALVRAVAELGEEEGVALNWWSPWNEPNQPYFISPQRPRCDVAARSLAPRVYAALVQALRGELDGIPGQDRLVLGELAAASGPKPLVTGVGEFIRGLPEPVVCAADVWAQHQYAEREAEDGPLLSGDATDAAAELRAALDARLCTKGKPIWITETGVGGAHVGAKRSRDAAELRADCRALERYLRRWQRDPRVDAAFQYSVREDVAFPVGLFDTGLTQAYPAYELWRSAAAGRVACPR